MKGTSPLKPMSNWHRMLTMLDRNDGTLYRAQMYQQPATMWSEARSTVYKPEQHSDVITGGMPKMTGVKASKPLSFAYEHRAEKMGLIAIQYHNNRKWIILLPKGRTVLMILDRGQSWVPDSDSKQGLGFGVSST